MLISLGLGLFVLGGKTTAYLITDSAAILSDAIESVAHLLVVAMVVWFMRLAPRAGERAHPLPQGRAEFFAVGFEGGLVFLAGFLVIGMGIYELVAKVEPRHLDIGFSLVVGAAAVNLCLGIYLHLAGRRARSPLLQADARQVFADVCTSAAVAAGALLMWGTGWLWLDAIIAILAGALIVFQAVRLLKRSLTALAAAPDPAVLETILDAINQLRRPEWSRLRGLCCIGAGGSYQVEFHLTLPGHWTIAQYAEVHGLLEERILGALEADGSVVVHVDAASEPASRQRAHDFTLEEAVAVSDGCV